MFKGPATFIFFLFLLMSGTRAFAEQEMTSVSAASHEYTLLLGYGITHRGFGATRTEVQTVDAIGRFGYFLSRELGTGWWVQGRHELFIELPVHLAVEPRVRPMTGGYLLGSWKFTSLQARHVYPYVFAGGGILYVDLGLPTMGSRMDFSYQGGTGLQVLFRDKLAFTAEYRYHHISNAGIAKPNEPLNSSKFLFGLSFFH
jgi:lipid A 3-O-deacylase